MLHVAELKKDALVELLDRTLPAETEPTVCLATCDRSGPHVRVISLVRDGLAFYFATSRDSEKMQHFSARPDVEFVAVLKEGDKLGSLRVAGTLIEVPSPVLHDVWTRGRGYDAKRHFAGGLDDPNFIAYRVCPVRIRLRPPGEREVDLPLLLFAQ